MICMGLDVSSKTGVAVASWVEDKLEILHGEQIRVPSGSKGMRRAGAIAQRVLELCDIHKPDKIVIEDYAVVFAGAAITLIEIGAIVRYFLEQEVTPDYVTPTPSTLKKFCTGKGNAPKDVMVKEVYRRWGYNTDSNDVADAVAAAVFGCALFSDYDGLPAQNMEAVHSFLAGPKKKKSKQVKNTI